MQQYEEPILHQYYLAKIKIKKLETFNKEDASIIYSYRNKTALSK